MQNVLSKTMFLLWLEFAMFLVILLYQFYSEVSKIPLPPPPSFPKTYIQQLFIIILLEQCLILKKFFKYTIRLCCITKWFTIFIVCSKSF